MRTIPSLTTLAYLLLFGLAVWARPQVAEAQYKNNQIGVETSYYYIAEDLGLKSNGVLVALRGAYKASDHWWFTARAGLSFRGEVANTDQTAVVLHIMPIDARYYIQTDRVRPFIGVSNAFTQIYNTNIDGTLGWGPGATAGVEIFLARDIFLGLQAEGFWMFIFEGPDVPQALFSVQLNFFL